MEMLCQIQLKKKLAPIVTEREKVEKTIFNKIIKEFRRDNIKSQYYVRTEKGSYKIDCYFVDYKIAIEIDEWGHESYSPGYDKKRQSAIEKELKCEFLRFNPYSNTETMDDFFKKLRKLVEYQKEKYKIKEIEYTFCKEDVSKLYEIACINSCSIEEVIRNAINKVYIESMEENKNQLSIS